MSEVHLEADVDLAEFILKGWTKVDPLKAFPTFTTSRPRSSPGHRPAGVQKNVILTHCGGWKNIGTGILPTSTCQVTAL